MKRRWSSGDSGYQEVPTTPSLIGSRRRGHDGDRVPNCTSSPDSSTGIDRPLIGTTSPVTPASINEGVVPRDTPATSTLSCSVESGRGAGSPYNRSESDVSLVSVTPSSIAEQRVPRKRVLRQSEPQIGNLSISLMPRRLSSTLWFDSIDELSRPPRRISLLTPLPIERHNTECRGDGDISTLWFDELSKPHRHIMLTPLPIEQHNTECRGGGDADYVDLFNANIEGNGDNAFRPYFEDADADIFEPADYIKKLI